MFTASHISFLFKTPNIEFNATKMTLYKNKAIRERFAENMQGGEHEAERLQITTRDKAERR